jgi:diacylglycerol kinase
MKNQPLHKKMSNASKGIYVTLQAESNFRIQLVIAILIVGIGLPIVQPPLVWWAMIMLCIGLVLAAELTNTALEVLLDHLHPDTHPEIAKVKDIMAGMVLVLSITTVIIGLLALFATYKGV